MTEKQVEEYLKREIEKLGGKCYKWVCPGQSGVPDRICILPGGRIYFVELKRPKGGRVSSMQKYMHKILRNLGCNVFLLLSPPMVDKMILEIKNGQEKVGESYD